LKIQNGKLKIKASFCCYFEIIFEENTTILNSQFSILN